MKKMCLIDASGFIHRAYHALPPLTTSKGEMVNAVFGFSRMVQKLLKSDKPDYLAVCFDTAAPTFRHVKFQNYKANREEHDDTLVSQFPLVGELAEKWGLPCVRKDGFEADDIIATLARQGVGAGCSVLILSGDKDLLQMVGPSVKMRDEIRKTEFDEAAVVERYGLKPAQWVDYQSLMGDKIDNIPGVPGVGEKTAQKLIVEYGSLENLYTHISAIPEKLRLKLIENKEVVFNNRDLVRLKDDVPLDISLQQLERKPVDESGWLMLAKRLEFKDTTAGEVAVKSDDDLSENTSRQVHLVADEDALHVLVEQLSASDAFAFDTETDGLSHHQSRLIGLSISTAPEIGFYVPIAHRYLGAPNQLPWDLVCEALNPFFKRFDMLKIGHNLKFDNGVLTRHGVDIQGPQFDTMIAAYCLNPSRNSYGLKALVAEEFSEKMLSYQDVAPKGEVQTFAEVELATAARYSGADAECTYRLFKRLSNQLEEKKLQDLFFKLEMPLVEVIGAMEKSGILVDSAHLLETQCRFEDEKAQIQENIFKMSGETFVLDSPKQLSRILFEKLKLPPLKKTKTGYSTNEEVLLKLGGEHPICAEILRYRELAKLISTYVVSLLELADPQTGRIHANFHQTGTITGRLSSSDPNLQNIPVRSAHGREIKKAFIAPPRYVFVSADYSQIDLRALAHMSGDPTLVAAFKAGRDIHTETASQIFHQPASAVTSEMRQRAKAINFGVVYGQQAYGLSQSLGISIEEAQQFISKYFERYAGVKTWIEQTMAEARRVGEVVTLAGRRRPVPEINSTNSQLRGFAERISINTPIQGTSADIIKFAMINIFSELRKRKFKSQMLVQVHDELLFEVPEDELSDMLVLIQQGMESAFPLKVPLVVDMKTGRNWSDMEKVRRD